MKTTWRRLLRGWNGQADLADPEVTTIKAIVPSQLDANP